MMLDSDDEKDFLAGFRLAGRGFAAVAAFAAAMLFLVFLIVEIRHEDTVRIASLARLGLAIFLLSVALALWRGKITSVFSYICFTGIASFIALSGILFVVANSHSAGVERGANATASFVFGLFLHYSFLRLPLIIAAGIGWSIGLAAIFITPLALGGDIVRHAVYLAFANIFGMVLCKLIENRERELFFLRRQAESARLEASRRRVEAEEAVALKDRLIAAVGHDLRQPMTAAALHLGIVAQRLGTDDLTGARSQIDKAGQAMASLGGTLEHLLTSARYDGGAAPMHLQWLDLKGVLLPLVDNVSVLARHRKVEFRLRLPTARVQIRTDRIAFERMVSNLLDNALKYAEPRGGRPARVLLAAHARADHALIEVIDTGPGIPEESASRIWEPYTRIEHSAGDRTPGLGLGLFLVRRMSEQLPGHRVRMRSAPGCGARFTVELPARRASRTDDEAVPSGLSADNPDTASLWGACVLLIEDDRDVRLSLEQLLTEWGVIVLAAPNMSQAQAALVDSERLVDAVISDYHLPGGVSGLQALSSLRSSLGYSFGAIIVTGDSDLARIHAQAGRDTIVLRKPLSAPALLAPLVRAVAVGSAREPSPV